MTLASNTATASPAQVRPQPPVAHPQRSKTKGLSWIGACLRTFYPRSAPGEPRSAWVTGSPGAVGRGFRQRRRRSTVIVPSPVCHEGLARLVWFPEGSPRSHLLQKRCSPPLDMSHCRNDDRGCSDCGTLEHFMGYCRVLVRVDNVSGFACHV